jgi:UDP-N-acetylglucosamine 1-carboxyvinyltransferase
LDMFVVEGGRPLSGVVRVGGSKNATLPIMAASLMIDGVVQLSGIPKLVDILTMKRLLSSMNVEVQSQASGALTLRRSDVRNAVAPYELVRQMRASVCVLGPLLARTGSACVSLPGGCNIGHRPIDLHLRGLAALGAEVRLERGYIHVRARQLTAATVDLAGPHGSTVTGTCNLMMAACLARGTTRLQCAAREPEVVELATFLNKAGGRVHGAGTGTIEVEGVQQLTGVSHTVAADRIEAATIAAASAITNGDVLIENAPTDSMTSVIETLSAMGVQLSSDERGLHVSAGGGLRPCNFSAIPFPGIPTDVQAQLMALLAVADGTSHVRDTVFPDRFMHAAELNRLGADITVGIGNAVVRGVKRLSGSPVMASDLRASAALVVAALAAEGRTEIRRVYHLDRGYEAFETRLNQLGATVHRMDDRTAVTQIPPPHLTGDGRRATPVADLPAAAPATNPGAGGV